MADICPKFITLHRDSTGALEAWTLCAYASEAPGLEIRLSRLFLLLMCGPGRCSLSRARAQIPLLIASGSARWSCGSQAPPDLTSGKALGLHRHRMGRWLDRRPSLPPAAAAAPLPLRALALAAAALLGLPQAGPAQAAEPGGEAFGKGERFRHFRQPPGARFPPARAPAAAPFRRSAPPAAQPRGCGRSAAWW